MAEQLFKYNIYGDLLHSTGYSVDFAMGTTYSLDLEALVGVPLSFGMLGDMDDAFMNSPLYILESIRKSSDKIVIFCNSAGISVPKKQQPLFSLLEKSVFEVRQNGSFHPKLWFIKESNDRGESRVKIIVSSRNLTFDSSIDMVASFTGKVTGRRCGKEKHSSLINYIKGIARNASQDKRRDINRLCEAIDSIDRFEVEHPFEDYEFFPINPRFGYSHEQLERVICGKEIFIVSPFIDINTLRWMTKGCSRRSLVTRRSYITGELLELFDGEVYAVNEELLSDVDNMMDIHAKIYFVHNIENGENVNYLFIGSANATEAAFGKNTEFLLRLKFKPKMASYNRITNEFLGEVDNKYVRIDVPTAEELTRDEQILKDEERILKEAVTLLDEARVTEENFEKQRYMVSVSLKRDVIFKIPVFIYPLQCRSKRMKMEQESCFWNMMLKELSEFYVLEVGELRRVVKIKTSGIPQERDEYIYKSIVDTEAKFINYISFMLSDDPQLFVYENENFISSMQDRNKSPNQKGVYSTLYEDMLRIAHTAPERLRDVEELISKVDRCVIPEDFYNMYEHFKKVLKLGNSI